MRTLINNIDYMSLLSRLTGVLLLRLKGPHLQLVSLRCIIFVNTLFADTDNIRIVYPEPFSFISAVGKSEIWFNAFR